MTLLDTLGDIGSGAWDWTKGNADWLIPLLGYGGSKYLQSRAQSDMAQEYNQATVDAYNQWLSTLNRTPEEKAALLRSMQPTLKKSVNTWGKNISRELGKRGVQGKPTSDAKARQLQHAMNMAYFPVHTQHQAPGQAGPVNYAPGTSELFVPSLTQDASQLLGQYIGKQLYG